MAKAGIIGTVGISGLPAAITDWVPKALVVLAICMGLVVDPLRRSRLGLSISAVDSRALPHSGSGVSVDGTTLSPTRSRDSFAAMGGAGPDAQHRNRCGGTHPRALPAGERCGGRAREA